MNNPKVSIIIATYNSAGTIKQALDSVYNQKYDDWECIIIDGASNDGTIQIVKEYESLDRRFRYISERDNGIYDAFNKGWRLAKGEWIHYLGSDDTLTKDGLYEIMSYNLDNYGAVSGDVWIKKIDGVIKENIAHGYSGCHQGKLVRRSIMKAMNGFDEQYRIMADRDLMYRLENKGIKILNIHYFIAYLDRKRNK